MMRRFVFLITALLFGCSAENNSHLSELTTRHPVEMFEVSTIYPFIQVPELIDRALFIDQNKQGKYVPEGTLAALDQALVDDNQKRSEEDLRMRATNPFIEKDFFKTSLIFRLVAFRLDPCSNHRSIGFGSSECIREIRLVWQRFSKNRSGWSAVDANIHTTYKLTTKEFSELFASIREVSKEYVGKLRSREELSVHPLVLSEGADSKSFDKLNELVSKFATVDRITTIAAFGDTAATFSGHWPMLSLSVKDGVLEKQSITSSDNPAELFVQRLDGIEAILSAPMPLGNAIADFKLKSALPREVRNANYLKKIEELENPSIHELSNTDCASCHVANIDRARIEQMFPELKANLIESIADYPLTSPVRETNRLTALQMFSFFTNKLMVTRRTVIESALIADYLSRSE